MDKIEKQVRLLHKSLKGEITVPAMIKYLERHGYNTVFFNTEDGDDLIRRCGIKRKGVPAFTYSGIVKVVFVDDLSPINEKIYNLLHECAHIVLGQMSEAEIHTLDKRSTENEAEAFAYAALHYRRRSFFRKMRTALSALCDSVISSLFRAGAHNPNADKLSGGRMEKMPCNG